MRWFGIVVSVSAAYALAGSPLAVPAAVVAVVNVAAAVSSAWLALGTPVRAVTALQHLTTALAGFLLFVWLAAR
jgi:hypothetical protein